MAATASQMGRPCSRCTATTARIEEVIIAPTTEMP